MNPFSLWVHQFSFFHSPALVAVLQGWDVADEDITAQIRVAERSGVAGYVVSNLKIDQSWQPQVVKWK